MHVLVTRPVQDAEPFKTRIEALGCRVTLAPLVETIPNDIPEESLNGATALVATSRNALTALARSRVKAAAIKLPLFVVGPGTAAMAREIGFAKVQEGNGRAEDLVPILTAAVTTQDRLIYLRGDVLAFDLEAALVDRGVNILSLLAYRSVEARTLPADVIKALKTGSIDAVSLMSPRTARIWARLVEALPPPVQLSGTTYLCLSKRVAGALGHSVEPDKVLVASQPNLAEMLALIKRLAASSKAE